MTMKLGIVTLLLFVCFHPAMSRADLGTIKGLALDARDITWAISKTDSYYLTTQQADFYVELDKLELHIEALTLPGSSCRLPTPNDHKIIFMAKNIPLVPPDFDPNDTHRLSSAEVSINGKPVGNIYQGTTSNGEQISGMAHSRGEPIVGKPRASESTTSPIIIEVDNKSYVSTDGQSSPLKPGKFEKKIVNKTGSLGYLTMKVNSGAQTTTNTDPLDPLTLEPSESSIQEKSNSSAIQNAVLATLGIRPYNDDNANLTLNVDGTVQGNYNSKILTTGGKITPSTKFTLTGNNYQLTARLKRDIDPTNSKKSTTGGEINMQTTIPLNPIQKIVLEAIGSPVALAGKSSYYLDPDTQVYATYRTSVSADEDNSAVTLGMNKKIDPLGLPPIDVSLTYTDKNSENRVDPKENEKLGSLILKFRF